MPGPVPPDVDRVSEVFRDKTIFITGATGFLGKVLLEKLLRVTEVKRLYLLIRGRNGKTPKDRLNEMFDHVLFLKLNELRPDASKKCCLIVGDITETNLGLDIDDRKLIAEEVDYIFHSAATTRFDDPVKFALLVNTRGTKYMLDLARECKKLKCFAYISTAYAFPNEEVLYEKPYDSPADPKAVLTSIDWLNEISLSNITKELLKSIPNTYTLSKSLAEGLINGEVGKLPVCIMRPAIILPTFKEPFSGYYGNLQSPMGLLVAAARGVVRSVYMDSKTHANFIPADSTVNVMMIGVWDYINTGGKQYVFNIGVPEEDIKLNWEEIIELGREISLTVPFNGLIWYPGGSPTKSKILYHINLLLFQFIPAIFIDFFLCCLGYKPVLCMINMRLYKAQEMFEYYTTKEWHVNGDYMLKRRREMTEKEKEVYPIESEGVDLKKYMTNCVLYTRRHIMNMPDETLPAARRNLKIFFVADRIVKITFFAYLFYFIYKRIFA